MIIGVMAGTPVDTQMGIEYIESKGYETVGFACAENPEEQNNLQILHREELLQIAIDGCMEMVKKGAKGIFVYCNSLSGAIDMDKLKEVVPVFVITPLDIYKMCAKEHNRIAVIAANGQSFAAIERVILSVNPTCTVCGAGLLPLVSAIETLPDPAELYERFNLKSLTDSLIAMGSEVLIIGCTHFPYIEKEIRDGVAVEVINPSDKMLEELLAHQ